MLEMRSQGWPLLHLARRPNSPWEVGGRELVNGDVLELRLATPSLWLPIWVEGLPRVPVGCLMASNGQVIRIALYPGAVLRWPRRAPDRLRHIAASRVSSSARTAAIEALQTSVFTVLEEPQACLKSVLDLLERHAPYYGAFARQAFAVAYPVEIARIEEISRQRGGPDGEPYRLHPHLSHPR